MSIPLNIDWQQILLHLFNFVILAGGLYFLLYKPVKDFMEKRKQHYEQLDAEANEKLENADKLEKQYQLKLESVDEEILEKKKTILESAEKEASVTLAEAKDKADKMVIDAKTDIEREREKMLEDSKKEVAGLAVEATKKLLAASGQDAYDSFLQSVDGGDTENGK